MLNQYTWGDFALFVLVLVVVYYMVVGFMYYRQELGGLLTRKGGGGAQLAGAGVGPVAAASGPPSLVRTTSAFVTATPTATESKEDDEPQDAEASAGQNLPDGQEVAEVTGSLPDSTAAATGSDDGQASTAPMDSATETEADTAAEYDEQRTEELDEVDTKLAARARQLAAEMPTDGTEQDSESIIEKNNNESPGIETNSTFIYVEAETAYEQESANDGEMLFSFDVPITSPVDVAPMVTEQLYTAASVIDFIAQAQAGNRPAVPAAIEETTLASQFADLTAESNDELTSVFIPDSI